MFETETHKRRAKHVPCKPVRKEGPGGNSGRLVPSVEARHRPNYARPKPEFTRVKLAAIEKTAFFHEST